MVRCPGQDQRFWKPGDIFEVKCPACGVPIEFFKDEPKLKCRKCGRVVVNPKIDLGCAQWCRYAQQCVAVSAAKEAGFLRDRLINEMKKLFAADQKRIEHALRVLDFAEQIQAAAGGDPLIVKAAAILHDIGIHEAERKYGSAAGKYQEIEGPPIAEEILKRYDVAVEAIEHICRIIANHHSARDIDTLEFRIVWDADWLVNFPEVFENKPQCELQHIIERTFRTQKGREIAIALFLNCEDS
jgi:hypothetical protein